MKAMILSGISHFEHNRNPLHLVDIPIPEPKEYEVLLKVKTCGVCHTDLDEIEGRVVPSFYPIIPGHQIIGEVVDKGERVTRHKKGERVGVGWYFSSCKKCTNCLEGRENLCSYFKGTGQDANGGYAEYIVVPEDSAFRVPEKFSDVEAAPLLCGGAVGYRALKLSGMKDGKVLGLTGFGGSGNQVLKLARFLYPSSKIYVFARNEKTRGLALSLGADWAGDTSAIPPEYLDCIIDTTPAWKPIIKALSFLNPGGRLIINAISKENNDKESLLNIGYQEHLWLEKEIKTIANVTPGDIEEFLEISGYMDFKPVTQTYDLEEANIALFELKKGKTEGTKVLIM